MKNKATPLSTHDPNVLYLPKDDKNVQTYAKFYVHKDLKFGKMTKFAIYKFLANWQ